MYKESLRLWPVASSVRAGVSGASLRDPPTGEAIPLASSTISGAWTLHYPQYRRADLWGITVAAIDPSRFMARDSADARRAFQKEPRNGIGQELGGIETRVILAFVVRGFDFQLAYAAKPCESMPVRVKKSTWPTSGP